MFIFRHVLKKGQQKAQSPSKLDIKEDSSVPPAENEVDMSTNERAPLKSHDNVSNVITF